MNCGWEVYYFWLILVSKTGSHVLLACFRDDILKSIGNQTKHQR